MTALQAIRRGLCPRCRTGAIFRLPLWRGVLAMHQRCPVCGLQYEREQGYFVGAMYIGYALMLPPSALICLVLWRITGRFGDNLFLWTFLVALPLVPLVLRWSRVLWLHLDWRFDPGTPKNN